MKIKTTIKTLILLLIIWFCVHITFTIIDGLSKPHKHADLAVVLGNKVNPDGSLSERLTKRLECALYLYQTKKVKFILVSGGLGKEGFYEGDKMKDFLLKNGIPDSLIFVDNKGDNTLKTIQNTLALKEKIGFKSIIAVSQYYHLTRTKMLFRQNGFEEISTASPNYFEWRDIYSLLREFFAYYKELLIH